MRILITGSGGMLGRALCRKLSEKYEVIGLDIVTIHNSLFTIHKFLECDITDKERTVREIISLRPDVIIHTAAFTDVDGCEHNTEKAFQVNARGTETVAQAAQKCRAFLYYISTDFVFDGKKKSAYTEEDPPHPINIYGQSKLAGEKFVQSILKEYVIVRTSWLFGRGGKNFVDTILNKASSEREIRMVNDQVGSPTYTEDLAGAIKKLIDLSFHLNGIYHITNSGSCSRFEFACRVQEIAGLNVEIIPISSEEYPTPARRPQMSILNNGRFRQVTGWGLRPWQEALQEYLWRRKGG